MSLPPSLILLKMSRRDMQSAEMLLYLASRGQYRVSQSCANLNG